MHCVSPVNRSRQNAASFSAENRPVQSFSVMTHEIEAGRSAGEHRHAELFSIGTYVSLGEQSVLRASVVASRVPRGELCEEFGRSPLKATANHFRSEPLLRLRPATSAHIFVQKDAGRVENRHALAPSHRLRASSTARIDGHSRIGVRLSCGNFSNLRVFE